MTANKTRFQDIRVLLNSYEKVDALSASFGFGLSTQTDTPIPAFYSVTEDRYEIGNSNKIGLRSLLPHLIPSHNFYTSDLKTIMKEENKKNPLIGFYKAESVSSSNIDIGSLVGVELENDGEKVGEIIMKVIHIEKGIEFVPLVGEAFPEKQRVIFTNEDFEQIRAADTPFMVYKKLSDDWLKDTLKELKS